MASSRVFALHATERLPVQHVRDGHWQKMLHGDRTTRATVPRVLAEAAWQGYDAEGHGGQSCERLHERGGFDLSELAYYLARAVDEGRVRIEIVR